MFPGSQCPYPNTLKNVLDQPAPYLKRRQHGMLTHPVAQRSTHLFVTFRWSLHSARIIYKTVVCHTATNATKGQHRANYPEASQGIGHSSGTKGRTLPSSLPQMSEIQVLAFCIFFIGEGSRESIVVSMEAAARIISAQSGANVASNWLIHKMTCYEPGLGARGWCHQSRTGGSVA